MTHDSTRLAAHAALSDILVRNLALDTALPRQLDGLSDPRDRGFCHQLVLTVLRHHGGLAAVTATLLERPLPAKAKPVEILIELGLAQQLFLDVPDHASIDTTVALAGHLHFSRHRSLVNAVLRRAQRERPRVNAMIAQPAVNVPAWLRARWTARFGAETTDQIALANLMEPPLDLSVTGNPDDWAAKLDARIVAGQTIRRRTGAVTDLPGYDTGDWWVQDAAAALPARLLPLPDAGPVIDLCAAPGGKTVQLAAAGGTIIAVDRSARRLRRLHENLARLSLEATVVEADAATWQHEERVGAILLDAPCSATGTIRRRPDIPWTKSDADVASLAELQHALLRNAAGQLRPGGVLVYSVCSLEGDEGPGQIAQLLNDDPTLERLPVTDTELGFPALSGEGGTIPAVLPDGDVQTLPCHMKDAGGMDGFFISRLRKR